MSFGLPECGTRTEYGVLYTEYFHAIPDFITHVSPNEWIAKSVASKDNQVAGITCHVVTRQVEYGEWS